MMEILTEARGVGRRSGDTWLLDNITLAIHRGERHALVGPSGSGKTLLLRALAMLDPIDTGEIRWQGETVAGNDVPTFRSRVMYLHQRPALLEGTVEENLRQPFTLQIHRHKQFDRRRIVSLLESLARGDAFLSKQHHDLSGGEAQLTALLRAMQLDPDILLLDEPTSALDAESTEIVESLVANWLDKQRDQRATFWVTHDADQARRVSDFVRTIRAGRLEGDA